MINDVVKKRFLAGVGANDKKNVFVINIVVSKFEDILQKDLGNFSKRDAVYMLEQSGYYNLQTLRSIIRTCRSYCRWSIENKFFESTINPFDHICIEDIDLSQTLRDTLIRSPEALLDIALALHRAEDAYMELPIMCFLWLGLSYQEIASVRKTDFSEQSRCVYVPLTNRYVRQIPYPLCTALQIYNSTDKATRIIRRSHVDVYEDQTGMFVKRMLPKRSGLYGVAVSDKTLVAALSGFAEDYTSILHTQIRIDKDTIEKSGLFYTMFSMERSGVRFDNDSGYQLISRMIGSSAASSINDTLYLYQIYKACFWMDENLT